MAPERITAHAGLAAGVRVSGLVFGHAVPASHAKESAGRVGHTGRAALEPGTRAQSNSGDEQPSWNVHLGRVPSSADETETSRPRLVVYRRRPHAAGIAACGRRG